MKSCPFCAEDVQDAAIVCRFCGADLVKGIRPATTAQTSVIVQQVGSGPSAGVAAVLSFVIPGAGQMYCGRVGSGFLWLVAVVVGYMMFILPGLVLHIVCIVSAANGAKAGGAPAPTTASIVSGQTPKNIWEQR